MSSGDKKGFLERLDEGVILGDGGMTLCLERRGYIKVGVFTPECTVLHPEAVKQVHKDFARSGADVCQALTFYANESNVTWAANKKSGIKKIPTGREINIAAWKLAREVADEYDALVSISLTETKSYRTNPIKADVQKEFLDQLQFFRDEGCKIDFIVCEYFPYIEEMEWAIEAAMTFGCPVAASMCIGPLGDKSGVSTGECAVRMRKAGAQVVGINCKFDTNIVLESMQLMKDALHSAGLKAHLMCQPLGFYTPDVREKPDGYLHMPETYLAYEPRVQTRFEAQKYARAAYDMGIRYIGGCCGFDPHHVRAMSEELEPERKRRAEVTDEYGEILSGLADQAPKSANVGLLTDKKVWHDMVPATGRPFNPAFATEMRDC